MADDDLRRVAAGMHPRPWHVLGAHARRIDRTEGVAFAVWAPNAQLVSVTGDLAGRHGEALPLERTPSGVWERFVPGAEPGQSYAFEVRGADGQTRRKADPFGRWMDAPPRTTSRITDPAPFAWTDAAWLTARAERDPQRSPMRIYEVHLGSWRRGEHGERLGYAQLGPLLAEHCLRYGFTHVELMPIAEHPFGGSWGYQVSGFYAPTARYGTPDELRTMVDLLHRSGVGVIGDWVPAHFPRDEHGLARFDGTPLYEHADPRRAEHPDWGTLVFDFGRPVVRNFLIGNARYWLEEFHFDGLRVDAVASMLYLDYSRKPGQWTPNALGGNHDLEAINFLQELNRRCHDGLPGVVMAAEESTAFAGVTRPLVEQGLGFDFKWDLGWMHDTLAYFSQPPAQRWQRRNALTFRGLYLDAERWVLPLSHDEVVHLKRSLLGKMPGDRSQQFAGLRSLLADQVGQPGKKLLFMGTEIAPDGEWDHDRPLPWERADGDPARAGLGRLVADLGALYLASPALWAGDPDPTGFEWIDPDGTADASVVAWLRRGEAPSRDDEVLVVVLNGASTPRRDHRLGLPLAGAWEEALTTDSVEYGGAGLVNSTPIIAAAQPWGGQPASATINLPALGAVFLRLAAR